ncbi:MAG: glycerophosphodiester phosphodiesterase, partial [Burkholderiales bacterium]|nr:glycerophosphodiester phosphodiesterase [Burkholderiales bacterium]
MSRPRAAPGLRALRPALLSAAFAGAACALALLSGCGALPYAKPAAASGVTAPVPGTPPAAGA